MRKYLFNINLISAVAGGWGVLQTTRQGPRDWRLILMWVAWGATVAIAVGTIVKEASSSANELTD